MIELQHATDHARMDRRRHPFTRLICLLALLAITGTVARPAQAEIRRAVIDAEEPVPADELRGIPAYRKLRGRLFGEVDPKAPGNRIIQDIALAPRNARGRVEYISTFTLFVPVDPRRDNRVLLLEVPNRGGRGTALPYNFYRSRGYAVLHVGWQGDLDQAPDSATPADKLDQEALQVPRLQLSARPITGPYMVRVPTLGGPGPQGAIMRLDQGRAGSLKYFPASFDPAAARLVGGAPEGLDGKPRGARTPIPATDWTWWNCTRDAAPQTAEKPGDLCIKRLKGKFSADHSYMLSFTARDPLVLGLGLAALRDATSFFRYDARAADGSPNPIADRTRHTIALGASQVGNLVKSMIALGFTADERGRRVWDGAYPQTGARRTPINYRFATTGSSATLYLPGSEGVLWWGKAPNAVRGGKVAVSLLDRCERTRTCPKIFEALSGAELWNQRMVAGLATPDLAADIPLPPNVRRFLFPGTQHSEPVGGMILDSALRTDRGDCLLPPNHNPKVQQLKALLVALTDWVAKDTPPPPSRYPTLAAGKLVRDRAGALRVSKLPGMPSPFGLANPLLIYDYGPGFDYDDMSGFIAAMPPAITGAIPALVPQVDADGNEIAGARSINMAVPLGTYLSWNSYAQGPYAGQICSFNGSFIPFAKTRAERIAAADPRPSIEERYPTKRAYVEAVRDAVARAIGDRLLLDEDGVALLRQADEAVTTGDLKFLPE